MSISLEQLNTSIDKEHKELLKKYKKLEEGIEEYLTGQANLNLLESSFSIMGEMIERQGIDEAAQAQAAAVNTENLGLVQAGGYLAQGYLNYKKYDTGTTKT